MLKSLTAVVTALSLTLATATPTYAQGLSREDAGKLLIGLAAVAVIGAAIEENRDRSTSSPVHDQRQWNGINRNNNWSDLNRQQTNSRRTLPRACLRSVETRFGDQRIFGKNCLENNYNHASRLPARCAVRVYTNNGPVRGFDPFCLRDQGFSTNRRN
ncbi:hypothetical protein BC777_2371 [Yoonia maricola]|uniref:Uncharacterized protein n=1 Tax=Yoonia maricola TaxID=420999 RepID=A0A2M8W505_9RHOB|nr:hypothetical protein [Yoonia maricola]PJI86014.1 hypothetical protein BC777_2371 [Yoonia maricola]